MFFIWLIETINPKIVNTEAEFCFVTLVFPYAGVYFDWCIPIWLEILNQIIVRQSSGLFESVHTFFDLVIKVTILRYFVV